MTLLDILTGVVLVPITMAGFLGIIVVSALIMKWVHRKLEPWIDRVGRALVR